MALEKPIIPTFSLQERDRRWGLLRSEMKNAELHALVSLPNGGHWDQFGADTRYITQIGRTSIAIVPVGDSTSRAVEGRRVEPAERA